MIEHKAAVMLCAWNRSEQVRLRVRAVSCCFDIIPCLSSIRRVPVSHDLANSGQVTYSD